MKETPQYWELLSESDKARFANMQQEFSSGVLKRARNTRAETFDEMLDAIQNFCVRNDDDDWKRYLVCGVCWMDRAIAINTRQLRLLVCKCKSSINGSLQKMGYSTNMAHSESWKILFPKIPLLKDHFPELRKWTIRYRPGEGDQQQPEEKAAKQESEKAAQKTRTEEERPSQKGNNLPIPTVPLKFRQKMIRLQQPVST